MSKMAQKIEIVNEQPLTANICNGTGKLITQRQMPRTILIMTLIVIFM